MAEGLRETTEKRDILRRVLDFYHAAKSARESGESPRDDAWRGTGKAYWGETEAEATKAEWQSKVRLPKVANAVERFAASQKLAMAQAQPPYTMRDIQDPAGNLLPHVQTILEAFLARCGENTSGQPVPFSGVYGKMAKAGALKAMAGAVTWGGGRLRIDLVDPSELYYDATGRRLYRIRRREIDWHELDAMKEETDSAGEPLFDADAIEHLQAQEMEENIRSDREQLSGHQQDAKEMGRKPIVLLEFLGRLTDANGVPIGDGKPQLIVVANDKHVIRGPEPNPFDHGRDWIVYHPIIEVPFSVYSRSYVELFMGTAEAFQDLTNVILDGATAAACSAYEIEVDWFDNPEDIAKGVHPGAVFRKGDQAVPGERGILAVDMGKVDPGAVTAWQGLNQEYREASSQNELSVGQLARREATATEIVDARQGSETLSASITADIEDNFLAPLYELAWLTTVQHLTDGKDESEAKTDAEILSELPEEAVSMIVTRRDEFLQRSIRFRVRGLSGVLERQRRARALLNLLPILGSSEVLSQAYAERYSIPRTVELLLRDSGAPVDELEKTPEEIQQDQLRAALGPQGTPAGPNGGSPPAPRGQPQGPAAAVTGEGSV